MPRLYRLFSATDNSAAIAGDANMGVFSQYVGRWNLGLTEGDSGGTSWSFDTTWRDYGISPFLIRPFGVLATHRTVGFGPDGNPGPCNVGNPRDLPASVMGDWTDAHGLRRDKIRNACGYDGVVYIGPPDHRVDPGNMAPYLREMFLAGWGRIGLDVGGAVSRTPGKYEVMDAMVDGIRSRGGRAMVEAAALNHAETAAWFDGKSDWVMSHTFATLAESNPTLMHITDASRVNAEGLVGIQLGETTPDTAKGRFDAAMAWRAKGVSVAVEVFGFTGRMLRDLRAEFGA